MSTKAASIGLCWDFAVTQSADDSRRWVLSAMQKHGQGLVTMLWRILGNEHDVCDAYQQTFLNLAHYQQQDKVKPTNVHAFLFRTAANNAISVLRRKRTRKLYVESAAPASPTEHKIDFAQDLDTKLLQDTLRSAISKLPDYLREVIVMRDLAELTYAQLSAVLGISAATARVYRTKAITLLAVLMAGESKVTK